MSSTSLDDESRHSRQQHKELNHGRPSSTDAEKGAVPVPAPASPTSEIFPPAAYLSLVGGFIALFCGFGFINAFGVFESYYKEHIIPSSSESTISWIGSMQVFFMLASNILAGPVQDKYGPKPLLLTYTILFAFSCMMISLAGKWWELFLAQGVLQGITLSFGFAPPMACAIAWFKHKSPIAVAVIVSGSSIGGVVWPIIVNALLQHVGFGWTWRAIGFIGFGLLLTATALVSQPAMSPVSETQDGVEKKGNVLVGLFHQSSRFRPPPRPFFYWDAFKIPAFNSYLASFSFFYLGFFYTFFYLPSWGVLFGLSESLSFYSISILNAASFFGRLFLPFLSFKLGPFNVLLICALASTIIVYASLAVNSSAGVLIIGGFYGFWSGGLISMFAPCVASLVQDKSRIGSAIGQLAACCCIPALLGAPICGWIIAAPASPYKGFHAAQGFSAATLSVGTIGIFITKLILNRNPLGKA